MKALIWQGTNKVGIETVPDPTLLLPSDAIVKITSTTTLRPFTMLQFSAA